MKTFKLSQVALCIGLTALFTAGCASNSADEPALVINEQSSELEKVGYSYGYVMAMSNKELIDDLNLEAFYAGFKDAYTGQEMALTEAEIEKLLTEYEERKITELRAKQMAKRQESAGKNQALADEFLASNAAKAGVKSTASGLQYKIIDEGTGASPTVNDTVLVQYEGKLIDGTIFDSSYKRDQPAQFAVQQVVPGFAEGLMLMKEGAKYEFYLPPELGYGEAGTRGIDSNSALIFTVELLDINP